MVIWLKEEFEALMRLTGLDRLRRRKLSGKLSEDLAWSAVTGKAVCAGCGYRGEDIQGTRADLWKGYGCPRCHSALIVKATAPKKMLGGMT